MKILKFPDPFLFKKTEAVTAFGKTLKSSLDAMYETMQDNKGLGLAANQVGLPFSMLVMEGPEGRLNIVNPKVTERSLAAANLLEGCLSAIGEFMIVPDRPSWVQLEYQDETGNKKSATFSGIYAVCITHEIEHLEGKSFMQNESIPKKERKRLAKKWRLK